MTEEEIARIALLRESQSSTPAPKKEKQPAVQASPEIDVDAEVLRRLRGQVQPEPLPSREVWQARNPGADYDQAMKERQDNPMQAVDADDPETIKFREIQAQLIKADKSLEERLAKESNKSDYLLGAGALAGADKKIKQQEQVADSVNKKYSHLPPEARPVDSRSLQRYINSQFSHQIPLDDLKRLTGIDIRTMAEVQEARRMVEGSDAQRIPVKKDVSDPSRITGYRNVAGTPPIDISGYAQQPQTFFSKMGRSVAQGAQSMGGDALGYVRPVAGGMIAFPQLYDVGMSAFGNKPIDIEQSASGLGGLAMMSKSNRMGTLGGIAQLPYAIKNREELLKNMTMGDINPVAYPAGTAESTSSPMQEPTSFGTIGNVLKRANEEQRKKLGYGQQQTQPQTAPLSFFEKMREEGQRAFPNQSISLLDRLMMPAYMGAIAGRRD
jgi:hypothetical protein